MNHAQDPDTIFDPRQSRTQHPDHLTRFIFEDHDIRGEMVQLQQSWQEILGHHDYPPVIRRYLGEMLVATTLLAATLKLDGSLSVQCTGRGALNLLLTECRSDLSIRGIAKYQAAQIKTLQQQAHTPGLSKLLTDGAVVITIEQKNGQRYQGIVPLEGNSIAQILENHLLRSEQLKTRLYLACDETNAAGMLLQELPTKRQQEQIWSDLDACFLSLSTEEILRESPQNLIYQLFHEYEIRLFDPNPIRFRCSCSREKVSQMLLSLNFQEAKNMIEQSEYIDVGCEFCGKQYRFDELDITELFTAVQKPTYH